MNEDEILKLFQENPDLLDDPDIQAAYGSDVTEMVKSSIGGGQSAATVQNIQAVPPQAKMSGSLYGFNTEDIPSMARSVATGLGTSLVEPVISTAKAPFTLASDALAQTVGLPMGERLKKIAESITDEDLLEKTIELDLLERKKWKEQNPGKDFAATIGGALIPSPMNVGNLVFKGAGTLAKSLPVIGEVVAKTGSITPQLARFAQPSTIQKVGQGIASAALGGGTVAGLEETGQQASDAMTGGDFSPGQIAESAIKGAKFGGQIGGVTSAVPAVGRQVFEKTKDVGKTLLGVFTGTPKGLMDVYTRNIDRINSAPSKEALTKQVADFAHNIFDDTAKAKLNLDDAKTALNKMESDLGTSFGESSARAREIIAKTKEELDFFKEFSQRSLKEKTNLTPLTGQITNSINDLKNEVTSGSKAAVDLLGHMGEGGRWGGANKGGGDIETRFITGIINSTIKKVTRNGIPVVGTVERTVADLEGLKENIKKYGPTISLPQVKGIIQQLDTETANAYGRNDFNQALEGAQKVIRHGIDQMLKRRAPEYRIAMEDVAQKTRVLKNAVKIFKDETSTEKKLTNIINAVPSEKNALIELGRKTGVNYQSYLDEATAARDTLGSKSGLKKVFESSDEFSANQKAEEAYDKMFGMGQKKFVEQRTVQAKNKVDRSVNELKELNENMKGLDTVVRSGKTAIDKKAAEVMQGYLASQGKRQDKVIRAVAKMSDGDFQRFVDDAAIVEQFNKRSIQPGSSMTNAFAEIGGAIAKSLGRAAVGGTIGWMFDEKTGAGVGGSIGLLANIYGPRITKQILDASHKLGQSPTLEKLNRLNISPKAKKYLTERITDISARSVANEK